MINFDEADNGTPGPRILCGTLKSMVLEPSQKKLRVIQCCERINESLHKIGMIFWFNDYTFLYYFAFKEIPKRITERPTRRQTPNCKKYCNGALEIVSRVIHFCGRVNALILENTTSLPISSAPLSGPQEFLSPPCLGS